MDPEAVKLAQTQCFDNSFMVFSSTYCAAHKGHFELFHFSSLPVSSATLLLRRRATSAMVRMSLRP